MQKIILFIFSQMIFNNVSISQVDHIKEFARKTWMDYIDVRNRMDLVAQQLDHTMTRISNLETDKENNLAEIQKLSEQQDILRKKLRKSQTEYLKKAKEVERANDSIKFLNIRNTELANWADSFSRALEQEHLVVKQLTDEKKQLEKTLYYKIADLEIAEVENSYFSDFDIGYEGKNGEIIYSENSKGQSTKPLLRKLEFIRFEGSVYVPTNVDSLVGKILIYKDDKLFDNVSFSFTPYTKTNSYNYFEIKEKNIRLKEKIPAKSNLRIAFVTDKVYSINKKILENFYEPYKLALFVITSLKPTSALLNIPLSPLVSDEEVVETDSCRTTLEHLNISIINSLDYFTSEYIMLSINDSIISQGLKLLTYDQKYSFKYKFDKGSSLIKIKALSGSTIRDLPDCYLWLYVAKAGDDKIIYKKKIILKKDRTFALYLERE